jgi:Protein of unknown function (DUF2833).
MFIEARPSRLEDVHRMAPRLRREDLEELQASGCESAHEALLDGLMSPDGCTTVVTGDGEPALMFGTVPHPLDDMVGCIWMLGTDEIEKNRVQFLRRSKEFIDRFHDKYPVLMNYTYYRNTVHHRWLRWCGFMFINKVSTPGGHDFYEFVRVRND